MLPVSFLVRLLVLSVALVVASAACPDNNPDITSITGCPQSDGSGTYNCAAGMTITLTGSNFGPLDSDSEVELSTSSGFDYGCDDVKKVDSTTVTATLPDLGQYIQPNPHYLYLFFGSDPTCSAGPYNSLGISYFVNVTSSSSTGGNIVQPTASASASSSSSGGSTPPPPTNMMRTPFISGVSGCNNNATVTDTNNCDGESGASAITVTGANFTADGFMWNSFYDTMTVSIICSSGGSYQAYVTGAVFDDKLTANTPQIDKSDVNSPCALTLTHTNNQGTYTNSPVVSANSVNIQFSSYSSDIAEAFRMLGMSLVTLISVVVVVGIIVLIVAILCTLSCCCGVSLAFLKCCRGRPTTVVYSPQTGAYSSMA